jgi:hypothetical protein
MASINQGGNSSLRKAKETEKTPVYKTEEFRETIRRIKERDDGRPITPSIQSQEEKKVTFNVPTPGTDRPQRRRGSSFDQGLYEKKLEEAVRAKVTKETSSPSSGMGVSAEASEAARQAKIDKETKRLVDVIKRPRTVYLADGTPFYLTKEDERAELEKSLLGESALKRRWMMMKYDIASGVEKVTRLIDEGSQTAKEIVTDTNSTGNVFGSILQLGLNSAMLGVEYLKFGDYPILASKEKAEQLRRSAEAAKFTDPAAAEVLLRKAEDMDKGVKLKEDYNTRLKIAGEAVDRAWATLFQEVEESNEFAKEHYDPNMKDPVTGRTLSPMEQQVIYQRKLEEEARNTAAGIRTQAEQAYAEGDFEKAIQLTKDAIEQDKLASDRDAYGAYTWMREPEKYDKFKEDAALLELQKGAPLSKEEIRRLKEYHANSWTELTGELAFDPTNLIPAAILDKVLKVPLKTVSKVNKALGEAVPAYKATTHFLGSPVRWLTRESVQAGANRVARNTHNILERVSNAYDTTEEITKAVDAISNVIMDAKRAPTMQEQQAIFETARKTIPGLQQTTFQDFKKLMDAADTVDPTSWGKMYSDALTKAEDRLSRLAQNGEEVSDFTRGRFALGEVADNFKAAFVDPHRIYKGARLTDDTLSGWITKKARALSGDQLNEMMKLTKNDEWLLARSERLGSNVKTAIQRSTHLAENMLAFGATVRDLWATAVLTTVRWPVNNMVDTLMRSAVYGGKLNDDLFTLFMSTQRQLADELGMVPLEFNNALAREGVEFTQQVPYRLMYEGWRPKFGLFSYFGYEYKRLLTEFGDKAIAKDTLIRNAVEKMPDNPFKKALLSVYDGVNYRANIITALRAAPGAVQDLNTGLEFTFRLRMFHNEYFKLLKRLEPKFMERGMDALSPTTKEIAKQIWRAADGNPRRVTAYVDNLLGGSKNTPAAWSVLTPPGFDQTFKNMDLADRSLFVSSVQSELDEFITTATRNGKELQPADFDKFFGDLEVKMQDEFQYRMSQLQDTKGLDNTIRTDGQTNPVLTEDDIQGSMPVPKEVSERTKTIDEAIGKLNRKKWFRKSLDIHADFETAISDYAKVERVSGDGMKLVKQGDGFVIQVGDNLLKKNPKAYFNAINDTVISVLKNQDADLIRHSGFASTDQYETVMREFFADPTAVLAKDERQFLTLVNQMENHPRLRQIIEQTSPETVRKYDSALDMYRDIGEYSDVYGFNKRPDRLFMSEAEKIRPMPGSHVAAANDARVTNRKLLDASKTISPELETSVREFVGQMQVYRQELKQFYAFTYPGPLMRATNEGGRHAGWDLFYRLSEAEFKREAEIGTQLIELLQKDPEAAKKFMADANDNFAEFFLKENGIELQWDVDRQMIMNIRVRGLDGKMKNFTSRRDIANLQIRFFSPQSKRAIEGNKLLRLGSDPNVKLFHQLRNNLRDTFNIDTAHAEAWSKVMFSHAEKWAQETKQPFNKYFERLGFLKVDSSSAKGLGTLEDTRIVKRGAVGRDSELGMFQFYGLSHSNFESMVRETGELFFDDLVSMADHSPQAADDLASLKKFLEDKTGKKIRGNRLDQAHSDVLSDTFSSYIATGHGPDIKIKNGFDRLKKWITSTFDAVRDSKVAGEIPDETYRVLDRLFVEAKMMDVPSTNARTIQLMAKEAGLVTQTEDELLKAINTALDPSQSTYNALGEVPIEVAARTLGTPEKPLTSTISKELQEGWEVWRTNRNLVGFPEEALTDPDTFKAYLRQRMGEEWSEAEQTYNRLLWEVEQFEDAILNYHAGDDLRTAIFPRVHEAQMSDGMKTFYRNTVENVNDYEISRRALGQWKDYMKKMATEGHPTQLLTKDEQAALKAWAYGDGSKAKAEMIDTILNGSDDVEGAIPLVNKRMLDYQHTNVFDQFMKNWFPFWMFPSRSLPFWAETLATHPQLIANYEKLQRLSRSQRYQAGAVTSKGKPLPSLDGYIKIPGTDMWFNPMAPLSFRYLLDIQKSKDDILYAAQSEDDIDPKTFMASELMGMGQVYGFSLGPWAAWLIKDKLGIPDEIIPRYPLIPEIQLVPRWMVAEQIQRANQMNLFGLDWNKHFNKVYPEVPWHDYMVERRILENTLQQLQTGNLTQEQKNKIMQKAQSAIKYKGSDALWEQTYKEVTGEAATRAQASFFTGMYTKNFGDGEADLLALRNDINLLKSSLNNEFQASVFDLPMEAEAGWDNYLSKMDAPEGWLHRLYTDIGWVKNGEGELVRDPEERAIWLAKKIEMDEDQQVYYDKMAAAQKQLQSELRSLPIGADWELVKGVFDRYATEVESLDYLRTFEKVYGSNKPVELIQKDIANDWFRHLKSTKPNWNMDAGESYEEYQQRVMEWETNLPKIAAIHMRAYARRRDLNETFNALHEDQQFNTATFLSELVALSDKAGLETYEKENDDIFDALNKAWKDTYWDTYWNSVIGKDGYEVDLAEQNFYRAKPEPPGTDELYSWIIAYYGPDKFTRDEIAKYVEDTASLDIEQRRLQGQDDPEDFQTRNEIWDMLSWIGPGNKNRGVFNEAYANAGGDPDWLTTWYQESGHAFKAANPERLGQMYDAIQQAITSLGVKPPERADLVRYIKAQKDNEMFQQLVTSELGSDFYDHTDEDGNITQGIYSYYNALPNKESKAKFREEFPEEYERISAFYGMKEVFQEEHPVWADYYGFDTEPSVSLPVNEQTGTTLTPPSVRPRGGGGGGSGGGTPPPTYRPTQPRYGENIPQFNIYDRTSNYISPGLYSLAGNKLGWEITSLYSSNRRISSAGVSFLKSLRSRYPQYQSEIDRILAKGS